MLRITRKVGQAIKVYDKGNNELTIIVTQIDGQYVRLGFVEPETDQQFEILREELLLERNEGE